MSREEVILKCVEYLLDYNMSVREIADNIGIGTSTVYKYLTESIRCIDDDLYTQCKNRLRKHKECKRDWTGKFKKQNK